MRRAQIEQITPVDPGWPTCPNLYKFELLAKGWVEMYLSRIIGFNLHVCLK